MLVHLLYASRAVQTMSGPDLVAILKQSREHNASEGITGLLCHSDGVFMQLLEGGRAAVNARYQRIASDPRHKDVMLLSYAEINEREFPGWTMGQVNLHRLNPGLVLKYSATSQLKPYEMSGRAMLSLFRELVSSGAIECA